MEVTTPVRTTVKEVSGGTGRGNQNDLRLEFDLDAATTVTQVSVRWPNGNTESFGPFAVDTTYPLREGTPVPVRVSSFRARFAWWTVRPLSGTSAG